MPNKLIPTEVHKLEKGKLYGDLAARAAAEPKPLKKMRPKCPRRLSKDEKKYWREFGKILENRGLFDAANAATLETFVVNYVLWLKCKEKLEEGDIIVTSAKGRSMINPAFYAMLAVGKEIRADGDRLGFSSQAMAKLGSLSARAKKKEGIEELLD